MSKFAAELHKSICHTITQGFRNGQPRISFTGGDLTLPVQTDLGAYVINDHYGANASGYWDRANGTGFGRSMRSVLGERAIFSIIRASGTPSSEIVLFKPEHIIHSNFLEKRTIFERCTRLNPDAPLEPGDVIAARVIYTEADRLSQINEIEASHHKVLRAISDEMLPLPDLDRAA